MSNRIALTENTADVAVASPPPTCGSCPHWFRVPPDPHNLAAPRMGACREAIHGQIVGQQGTTPIIMAYYVGTQDSMEACSRHPQYKPAVKG